MRVVLSVEAIRPFPLTSPLGRIVERLRHLDAGVDSVTRIPLGDLAEDAPQAGQGDDKGRQGSDKAGQTIQCLRPHYSPTLCSRRTLLVSRMISMARQKIPMACYVTQFCVNRTWLNPFPMTRVTS